MGETSDPNAPLTAEQAVAETVELHRKAAEELGEPIVFTVGVAGDEAVLIDHAEVVEPPSLDP